MYKGYNLNKSSNRVIGSGQWKNPDGTFHPVSIRLIRFRHGLGKPANDGDAYWVIN